MIVQIPSRLHQTMGPVFDIATQSHVTEEYGLVSLFEHLVDNHDNPREKEKDGDDNYHHVPRSDSHLGADRIRLCIHPSLMISHKMLEYHGNSINFSPAFLNLSEAFFFADD